MDFVYEGLCSVQECKAGSNSNCKMPESERGSSFVPSSDLQHIPLTFSLHLTFVFTSVFGSAGGVWGEERKPQTLFFGWQRNPFWVAEKSALGGREIHLVGREIYLVCREIHLVGRKYTGFAEKYTWLAQKYALGGREIHLVCREIFLVDR